MYENSLETATMQRAKTILYLEQKLSPAVWRKYCEHVQKQCSPEVSSLSEEMCLGRRAKKRSKERLVQNVEEIHGVMNERFGSKVGTEKSDMDKLLVGVNKLNAIFASQGHQTSTLTKPATINLNIMLDHGNDPIFKGVALKTEELLSAEIQCDDNQNVFDPKQSFGEKSIEIPKHDRSVPPESSARVSNDINDRGSITSHKIQKQLDGILNLLKEGIKNGKLNFTVNGRAVDTRTTVQTESVEHLLETDGETERIQSMTDCVDSAACINSVQGIMNPACSPTLFQCENEADETRHSSLDMYMSDDVAAHTPIQSPTFLTVNQTSINSDRLRARYEGSSFLSTSSTEGNTTCDETGFTSSQMSVVSTSNNTNQRPSPNQEPTQAKVKPRQAKKSHRRPQPPQNLFLCPGGSSESDFSSQESKIHGTEEVQNNYAQGFVCEEEFSSSTDITDHFYDDESQASGVDHYASTDIKLPETNYATSSERDSLIQISNVSTVPRVRWADTASEPGSTPFLNIREISASPSDNFSGDLRLESDTASGDEGHSGIERSTGQQTDV
jgi:hypothetical protein